MNSSHKDPQGYYRFPTIHGDTVVFVSEDDLWTVPSSGGIARRLTAGLGSATRPWFSPDGQTIAFMGREEGDQEVYIMPAQGGDVQRLTYLGSTTQIAGWDPEGHLIIATNYGQAFARHMALFTISLEDSGQPQPLPYGPGHSIAYGPQGEILIGRNTGDTARWKRYRGGTRGVFWIDPGTGSFYRYGPDNANCTSPMWIDDRIYFLSDHEGIANLYSMAPTGEDLTRHSDHAPFYARNASTDGQRIVYHVAADLYIYDPRTGISERLEIAYHSQRTQRERKYPHAARFLTEYALAPDGTRLALTSRGKPYIMGNWEGPVEQLGVPQGVRYRFTQWLPDQSALLTVSDETGEERVELHRKGEAPLTFAIDVGRVLDLKISPDGQFAVLSNHRLELCLLDLKTLGGRIVDKSEAGAIHGIDWSPDSRWIAYGYQLTDSTGTIKLYHLATNQSHQITDPVLIDSDPCFDPNGKFLYFLSTRTFNPVYDSMKFDLGFIYGTKPYCLVLSKATRSPFMPLPDDRPSTKDQPDSSSPETPEVMVDLEGIEGRVLAFPVGEARYQQLAAAKGKVYWSTVVPEGSLSKPPSPLAPTAKATLQVFDFATQKPEDLGARITSFTLSGNKQWMAIRAGNRLRVIKAGDKIDSKDDQPGRSSGLINLDRIVLSVEPAAEWAQMVREAWRLMRDNFWTENMSGVDWDATLSRYLSLLPRITTRGEFSDLMWELQGELGTSHAYEMGGDYRREPENRLGFLAADAYWDQEAGGYRLDHLVDGDSWNTAEHSPLLSPGVNWDPASDVLVAIDGRPLGPEFPPMAALIGKAKHDVELTIANPSGERTVVVRPLEQEGSARYRQWVDQNRRRVHSQSNQRIGYVHIPDMGPRGFAEFYRGYLAEVHKDALIVDVRYNGGGHVSQLILDKLTRRRVGYDLPRYGRPMPYPGDSVLGPIVALTNENAGSDGDIFSHSFKLLGIGPLVGTRTWGGVVGIWMRHPLVDGSVTSQPEFAFWFKDVGWGVENYGTDPDVEVHNSPEDYANGYDRQLEDTIRLTMEALETNPPEIPNFEPRPSRAIPRLPGRQV